MWPICEHSAGVIPFRFDGNRVPTYLVIHSATVQTPQARWEFPKGGIEAGEHPREAAAREFEEETGLVSWAFRDGFERSLSYTYMCRGQKHFKTVIYLAAEVFDTATMTRSHEHMEDPLGRWCHWGSFDETTRMLCHAKIRHLFAEVDSWLRNGNSAERVRHAHRRESAREAAHFRPREWARIWADTNTIPAPGLVRQLGHPPAQA